MQILIKPNWATGRLEEVAGQYRFFAIGVGGTRFRFFTDVTTFNINDKILITQADTESRSQIVDIIDGGPLGKVVEVVLLSGRYSGATILSVNLIDDSAVFELDGEIDLQINLKIFDLKDVVRSSAFTSTFELPFTDNNNRILTQLFNINVDGGYNWNKKSDLIITDGGSIISSGYIQIEEIDWSGKIYKCIFYGDNKNLFDDIGDNFIFGNEIITNDIDFSDAIHSVTEETVLKGWWREVPYVYSIIQDESNNFTKDNFTKGIEPFRWRMWWNSKDLFDRIFRKWGYTYESDFLNSDFFKKHLTLPTTKSFAGGEIIKWNNQTTETHLSAGSGTSVIPLSNEIINLIGAEYNPSTGRFTIPVKGDYYGNALISFGRQRNYVVDENTARDRAFIKWHIFRDGIKIAEGRSSTFQGGKMAARIVVSPNGRFDTTIGERNITIPNVYIKDEPLYNGSPLRAGDEIQFFIEYNFNTNYTIFPDIEGVTPFPDEDFTFISLSGSKININPAPSFYEIKQIDFIADIFKQFNLYIKPSKTKWREFLIEPRDAFYEGGKVVDFLNFDEDDVLISTLNNLSAKNWKFSYSPGDDVYNRLYQERFKDRVFGDAVIRLDNDFLINEKEITLNAQPILYSRVFDNVILPDIEGGNSNGVLRYGLFSGTQSFQPSFNAQYQFTSLIGPPQPFTYYPLITNYSDGISEGETILYATEASSGGARERSLYFNYWENEIQTYAEPGSHLLTLKVRFNSNEYAKIDFNDIYWLELNGAGRYYTLLEINNWNPNDTSLVEMVFLTYLDKKEGRPQRTVRDFFNDIPITDVTPGDTGFGNSPIPIRRNDGRFFPVDDLVVPNSPVRGNGWSIRGRDVVLTGVNEYTTVVGDNITLYSGGERVFISGNDVVVKDNASNSFLWNANDVNIDAEVVSWGATGKTHSVDNSFLFNDFNPVLDSKDQTTIGAVDNGTMVWNEDDEALYINKSGTWVEIGGPVVEPEYINIFDFTSGSETAFIMVDDFQILQMSSTEGFSKGDLSDNGSGLITYSGSSPRVFRVEGIASGSSGANNEIHFAFFKNGSLHPPSEQSGIAPIGGRATSIPFQCVVELDENDTLQVYVKNSSGTTSFTLQNINIIIESM